MLAQATILHLLSHTFNFHIAGIFVQSTFLSTLSF